MIRKHLLLALVSLAAAAACSNNGPVDIGRNVGSQLADYAAGWDGYAEAYVFDDGSDHVRLTLDVAGHGTLVVGDQAPPPPLPQPLPLDDPNFDISTYPALGPGLVPGLPYSIGDSHIQERRIQLSVNLNERMQQVCATQTPICEGDNCACLPYYGGVWACRSGTTCTTQDPSTGAVVEVTRNKFFLCGGQSACGCDSTGCYAPEYTALLDAALEDDGARLVGTLLPGRVTVRMTRD